MLSGAASTRELRFLFGESVPAARVVPVHMWVQTPLIDSGFYNEKRVAVLSGDECSEAFPPYTQSVFLVVGNLFTVLLVSLEMKDEAAQ